MASFQARGTEYVIDFSKMKQHLKADETKSRTVAREGGIFCQARDTAIKQTQGASSDDGPNSPVWPTTESGDFTLLDQVEWMLEEDKG
jgi:hypothetical protein